MDWRRELILRNPYANSRTGFTLIRGRRFPALSRWPYGEVIEDKEKVVLFKLRIKILDDQGSLLRYKGDADDSFEALDLLRTSVLDEVEEGKEGGGVVCKKPSSGKPLITWPATRSSCFGSCMAMIR